MADFLPSRRAHARRRVMVLGNCVAHRLQFMLAAHPGFGADHELVPAPMIHTLRDPLQWEELARVARGCDVVFSQPLFRFGPCNTEALRDALPSGTLVVMSAPNFSAYFPDVITLEGKTDLRFDPILDWDSSIIFSCFVAGVPVFEVETIYRGHPLFRPEAVRRAVAAALEDCARRDRNVDVSVAGFIARRYAETRLFHTWKHPDTPLLEFLLAGMHDALGLPSDRENLAPAARDGFGFNRWPVLTGHGVFRFSEQSGFRVGGQDFRLEDVAMAYYNFYEFHPHVVERNRHRVLPL